jgi:Zn-dependent protease with chaperone function
LDLLIYPREQTLGKITLVLGLLGWVTIIFGTFGLALVYVAIGFTAYVFAQSAWVARIRGNAVQLSAQQFPDLHKRLEHCCKALDLQTVPEAYILNGNGLCNAFARRFFGRHFVVLMADLVDAMAKEPDGINFYIGHELGHIRLKHLTGNLWRLPVLWLPLLGAAYARTKQYSCDRHGAHCCISAESAGRALMAFAAGPKRWKTADLQAYSNQLHANVGFFASFHELIGGHPWLSKRVALIMDASHASSARSPLAYVLACFVPYAGRAGGGAAGLMFAIATMGLLALIAFPSYSNYNQRAFIFRSWSAGESTRTALTDFYAKRNAIPASLEEAGLSNKLDDGSPIALSAGTMVVRVTTRFGTLIMVPEIARSTAGGISWKCAAGEDLSPTALPVACRM